jgi:hypothetical protein
LAASIISQSSAHEPFWENAGRSLLSTALKETKYTRHIQKLLHILLHADLKDFSTFFYNTDAATYTHQEGDKMTLSIRATLATFLQGFKYITPVEEGFSVHNWVQSPDPS